MAKRKRIGTKLRIVFKKPQQKLKTKVAFDASVTHVPNKKAKYSDKNKNSLKKIDTAKSNGLPVNPETEILGCSSIEMNGVSPIHSPINSAVKYPTPAVTQEISKNCCLCSKMTEKKDIIVDCQICDIRVHKACLIVNDPVWKLKLDFSPWLCERCRKKRCSKCLKECHSVMYYCVSCEVGLHRSCYESYYIKPMKQVHHDMFVCSPCSDLATQINPEEVDTDVDLCTANKETLSWSERNKSHSSFAIEGHDNNIPNSLKWSTSDVTEYFKSELPQEVIDKLTDLKIDGRAIQLLQRSDIVSNMGLKLGHALKLYKQVRILQTQSTHNSIFWE